MYLQFIAMLVLLVFAFRVLLALVAIPFALLTALFFRNDSKWDYLSGLLQQLVIALLFAGLMSVAILFVISELRPAHSWLYVGSGFVATFMVLVANVSGKNEDVQLSTTATGTGALQGASLGLLIGLIGYFVFYAVPEAILLIPGSALLIGLSFELTAWLSGFVVVRFILIFVVLGYLINAGMMLLIGTGMALSAVYSGMRRLFSSSEGS